MGGNLALLSRPRVLFALVALCGSVVTLLTFTLPALRALSALWPHLAALWSISGNRAQLGWIFVKAASPLLWVAIVVLLYWLWLALTDLFGGEAPTDSASPAKGQDVLESPSPATKRQLRNKDHGLPRHRHRTAGELAGQRRTRHLQGCHQLRRPSHPLAKLNISTVPMQAHTASSQPQPASLDHGTGNALPPVTTTVYVCISLLGEVSVVVTNPANGQRANVDLQAPKRRELLAFFAWQRGKRIPRDTILHEVFERSLPEDPEEGEIDEAEKVRSNFATQVKLLRQDINTVAAILGLPRLNVLEHSPKEWWLASYCQVIDLDLIEKQYRIIEQAVREESLEATAVRDACDRLIDAYQKGDFLAKHVMNQEYDPWVQCWVRDPFTRYRDYYLTALWIRAEGEGLAAEKITGDNEQDRMQKQRACFGRAAHFYETYALYAVNMRADAKVYGREPGERIRTSERALRRAMYMYGLMQNTQAVDALFERYKKALRLVFPSGTIWKPSAETDDVLAEARAQTRQHRLQGT